MKLRAKLILTFLLLSIIPVILVSYLAYQHGERTIKRDKFNDLASVNIMASDHLSEWIHNNESSLRELARRPLVIKEAAVLSESNQTEFKYAASRKSIIEDHLLPTIREEGKFLELFILRPSDGLVLASTNENNEGKYLEDRPYFIEGKQHSYTQIVYYSPLLESNAMTSSTPIKDMEGNLIAVLAGRVSLDEISGVMEHALSVTKTQDTYLINESGIFVTEPRFGEGFVLKQSNQTEGALAALSHKEGASLYDDYRGVPVIGAYRWLPEWNLAILTEIDQSEALKPIHDLRNIMLAIGVIVAAFVAALALFFSSTITRPVRRLTEGTGVIGSGNLDFKVGTAAKDEIGELSRAFDRMVQNLRAATVSRDEMALEVAEHKRVEEALRESEEWFSTAFHHSPIAMIVASFPEGRCLDVNDSFLRLLEYTREEVIGRTSTEVNVYVDPEEVPQMVRIFSEEGRVKNYEAAARTKTGKLLTTISYGEGLRIRGQDHVIHMIIDITERKQAEAALRKSEAFLAQAQRMAHLGNWEWDIITKEIIWSDEVYRIYGFQPQEFRPTIRRIMDSVHPDDRDFMEGSFSDALIEGKPYNIDRRLLRPNGEVRTVHEEGVISIDKSGNPVHSSGTIQDITERKRVEEKLAESERLYSGMANSSPVGVYIIQDGKFTFVNQRFCDLTGFAKNELSDMGPWSLVHPEDRAMVRANAVRMLKGQAVIDYEYRAIIKSGETRVILETVVSMQYLGKRATLGNYMDITERKQMEEKLQQYAEKLEEMVEERARELKNVQAELVRSERLAMLGQFSGSISHELRNPLGVIDSSAYYLKTKLEGADEKVALHIDRIKSAAAKANAIIQSILELTRMHAPKLERLDINAVISGAIATVDVPAQVNLTQDQSEPEIWVNGDLEQLFMAFQNIITNAVEAMEGAGTLKVTIYTTTEGQVEISISDSGMGIAPENLVRVFEPLFSTKAKGIGFGLAIAQMVIEKHKGTIEVKSEVGKGTTFIVRLPRSIGEK